MRGLQQPRTDARAVSLPWPDIYRRIARDVPRGQLFHKLDVDQRRFVFITGCQRSGTSWLRRSLGRVLRDADAPKELDVANLLLTGAPQPTAPVVVLQTTFANVYPESYSALPPGIPVILAVRNPYSVCRSLVYNWDSLDVEYAHRCGGEAGAHLSSEEQRWQAAVEIYCGSLRANLALVTARPARTHVVDYDAFAEHDTIGLHRLTSRLGLPIDGTASGVAADRTAARKQASLPDDFRQLIQATCVRPYQALIDRAQMLGTYCECNPN